MAVFSFFAVTLLSAIGWGFSKQFLSRWIEPEERRYFAPAIGIGACGVVGYVAAWSRLYLLIPVFCAFSIIIIVRNFSWQNFRSSFQRDSGYLWGITLVTLLALYGMQISVFYLFKSIYSAPDDVWHIFNLSGVSPPDQMFSWHQSMFVSQHRHYPADTFYEDMDFYDRPQLGGYLTLFFFKLFHLPLEEHHYSYPSSALRFYHCFWWLLNNLYLLAVAPLFRKLLGDRAALLGVASTALGGIFFLCNIGGWVRFAAAYPFLLAILLFIKGRAPVLQACLCAVSFYLHGSVLPFLLGFGVLQLLALRRPITSTPDHWRDVAWFAAVGGGLVAAWFVVVKYAGSKQPLLYYYLYDADLTAAQRQSVAELAGAFYARHSWASLSLLPLLNWSKSILPTHLFDYCSRLITGAASFKVSELASTIFETQRFVIWCAVGLVTAPFVLFECVKTLGRRDSGVVVLCCYVVPSLFVALLYRIDWSFSLHVLVFYHTLALFLWVSYGAGKSRPFIIASLLALSLEGIVCVLFADTRFLPVHGIHLDQISGRGMLFLVVYFILVALISTLAVRGFNRSPEANEKKNSITVSELLIVGGKVAVGLLIIAVTIAGYSIYCRQFYNGK